MWYRVPREPGPYEDDWEDQPAQGPFYQWGLGVLLPLGIFAWGLHGIIAREITDGRHDMPLVLTGLNATALGIAAASLSLFMHCHYFWGNVYNQAWLAVLGKIFGAIGLIAGLGVVIIRVGLLGIS